MLTFKRCFLSILNSCGIHISRAPIISQEQLVTRIENEFIKKAQGVLHIGAHLGQEGERYSQHGAKVLWIEALPNVYKELKKNIGGFSDQVAVCALLGDKNNYTVDFNLASNNLASSSIFKFGHELGFRKIKMKSMIALPMIRLDSLYTSETIAGYDHWVIDVQGAELLVLIGAGDLLTHCKSLLVEVSTRQVYEGGVSWNQLEKFLSNFGLNPLWTPREYSHENIIFTRFR